MTPQRQVPPGRKPVFYIGMAIAAIGFLCFISTFFSAVSHFGDFSDFPQRSRSMGMRAIIGMVMIIGGAIMSGIGRLGLAGSGLKLDPEEARRDVEPWARMTGGIVKDAMDEAGIKLGGQPQGEQLSFDERLHRLQKLRQDGLVSEQEYETARKKILESA